MTELNRDSTANEVIAHLKTLRNEANIAGMARFGIATETAIGISNVDLRKIARTIGANHDRARAFWESGIREARLLTAFTGEPKRLTPDEARGWASAFGSWEIVDSMADLFVQSPHWMVLLAEFAEDEREFVRRTAFAMIASASVHLKKEPDETLLSYLPLIEAHSTDPRNFVKKAVNWALRNIGKRSLACRGPALALAGKLAASKNATARWIGKDALREFEKKFGRRPEG